MDAMRVVAEPRRREILRLVWDQELSAGAIAEHFDVSFPAISQHLGVLQQAGFVSVRRDGTRRFYRADRAALGGLAPALERMWAERLADLAELAERVDGRTERGEGA
jgi:DNA-binding transcriptional ArsR family regulator